MVPQFKVTSKVLASFIGLLLLTLPSIEGNKDLKGSSSSSVENKSNNFIVNLDADSYTTYARLEFVNNLNTVLQVDGSSLKIIGNMGGRFSLNLKSIDLEVMKCIHQISGEKNKGNFWDFFDSNFTGNDNELTIASCAHCDFNSSNEMTITFPKSSYLRVQDSSNSKVAMLLVDSFQVSGPGFTMHAADIKLHTSLGNSCTGDKVTHGLTFLPERPSDHVSYYWDIERNVYVHGGTFINGVQVLGPNQRLNNKKASPVSLHCCNASEAIGPVYEIGGLPRLTIDIEEEKVIIKVTEGNSECKMVSVSEDGEIKVSISASSEQLIIEGAKDIRRVEDRKCEFILNLGKDAASASEHGKTVAVGEHDKSTEGGQGQRQHDWFSRRCS